MIYSISKVQTDIAIANLFIIGNVNLIMCQFISQSKRISPLSFCPKPNFHRVNHPLSFLNKVMKIIDATTTTVITKHENIN